MDNGQLIETAQPIVWRRGYQAGLSLQDREDLLQDVLLKYLRAWPGPAAPDNVAAWFEAAISNAIIDRARAVDRHPVRNFAEGGDDPLSLVMAAMRSPLFASLQPVRQELMREIFDLTTAEDAHLLRQRFLNNHPAAELAAELGISAANVDQRTTRAKRRLREALRSRPDLVDELRAERPHRVRPVGPGGIPTSSEPVGVRVGSAWR